MRLYVLSKRQFFGIFTIFFICLSVIIFLGINGPSVIQIIDAKIENFPNEIVNENFHFHNIDM